jgi:chain length determinant protein tyrosine kinase EpsG
VSTFIQALHSIGGTRAQQRQADRAVASADMKIGQILYSKGALNSSQVAAVLAEQTASGHRFGETALRLGLLVPREIDDALALQFGYTALEPSSEQLPAKVVAAFNPASPFVEALRGLRSQLMMRVFNEAPARHALAVISPGMGDGKTYCAANLAVAFGQLPGRTVLVDADLRRPGVAALLGIERPKIGIVEVVLGHVDLETALVRGVHENLDILPVGEIPPNPTEILASKEFQQFMARCRSEYSLVIFDSCPVMGIADAPMLSRMVDETVFVLEANALPFSRARAAIRRLTDAGAKPIGAILTKYRALEAGQAYDSQYAHYSYSARE